MKQGSAAGKPYTMREAIMDRAQAMGPCTIDGFLYEVRVQVKENATREEVSAVVGELISRGWLERYDDEAFWPTAKYTRS